VTQLARVSRGALEQADVKLVVIGCGEWNAIRFYSGKFTASLTFNDYLAHDWRTLQKSLDFRAKS
jgi:hypothetical protein